MYITITFAIVVNLRAARPRCQDLRVSELEATLSGHFRGFGTEVLLPTVHRNLNTTPLALRATALFMVFVLSVRVEIMCAPL